MPTLMQNQLFQPWIFKEDKGQYPFAIYNTKSSKNNSWTILDLW
jgi:hypothetical protein